jgi:molybdopterin-biosynthesis enzyme MoeA-like protein
MPVKSNDPRWKTAASDPKAVLTKYIAYARVPESELIPLLDELEKTQPEVTKFIDEAITLFSQARTRLDHARMRLK